MPGQPFEDLRIWGCRAPLLGLGYPHALPTLKGTPYGFTLPSHSRFAAPAPDVQEQPQHHLSSSTQPRRAPTGFTLFCAPVAVPEYSIGAGGLMDGRMRRVCSPYEAWGAGQRSRFAELASNCLKDSQTNTIGRKHPMHLLHLAGGKDS